MSYSAVYAQTALMPKNDAAYYLDKYGHLLKWKNYKENILDVGCGDGSVTREILFSYLEEHLKKLMAIDKLGPMIELANRTNDKKEITFETIDVTNKEYIARNVAGFDHIFSFYCFHWITETRALLDGLHEMLKPGGQMFITTLCHTPVHRSFKKHLKEGIWTQYLPKKDCFANYTENPEKYLRDLLENIGFEVELCRYEEKSGIIDNYKDFIGTLFHMSEYLEHIPAELREEYIQDLVKNVCEESVYLGDPDKYDVVYELIILVASKKM